jgi:hypothetical protein
MKLLAKQGNAEAQKIYEKLKPSYEAMLQSNICTN